MKKYILITGGLGYIGSHGVIAFEQAGYTTIIIDNLSNSSRETLQGITKILGYTPDFYEIDIRDKSELENIFEKYDFDGVVHFAGLKSVGESCEYPLKYFDNNVTGSLRLFECMAMHQVKNIVFSSSATVYNYDNPIPYIEDQATGLTTNMYATTKYTIEKLLEDLSKFSGFKVINLRYFNPIGAHSSGHIGENPQGVPNNLLPYIMKVVKGELPYVRVFGGDYDTVDGSGVRDYIDVCDLIEAHVKSYETLNQKDRDNTYENYNLGIGKGTSVLEMIQHTQTATGENIEYKIEERRQGDLGEFYCEPTKAQKQLGWISKTDLSISLKNSWNFYKNHTQG